MSSSLACETINSEDEQRQQTQRPPANKNFNNDDDELDFEEDEDVADAISKQNSLTNKNDDDDGELSDDGDEVAQPEETSLDNQKKCKIAKSKNNNIDKDEGEIDSDELEEGEVKEDSENEEETTTEKDHQDENVITTNVQKPSEPTASFRNNRPLLDDPPRRAILPRPPIERRLYHYSNNWTPSNQNYRYPPRSDRYGPVRPREPLLPSSGAESAWERGLKQAREMITRASKRKEAEDDDKLLDEGNRYGSGPKYERSPPHSMEKRSRRYSRNSSSEDEIERRHRLAYDAAPWNDPADGNKSSSHSQNYRRSNYYSSSGRSAEAYRDPWRRSQSRSRDRTRNRDRAGGSPLPAIFDRGAKSRSHSMTSLSSICSSSSAKSSGRKLPYTRPPPPPSPPLTSHRTDDKKICEPERDPPKTRFDRIPKKSNVSRDNRDGDRNSHTKSFDSWSESLSDSSSYYSNSDSDVDQKDYGRNSRKSTEDARLKSAKTSGGTKETITTATSGSGGNRMSKYGEPTTKVPIKMTFMRKQPSLKKDMAVDEQLNGGNISDVEEAISATSFEDEKSIGIKPDDVDEDEDDDDEDVDDGDETSGKKSPNEAAARREKLLEKLRAVEAAIERKLSSKN